MYLPIIIFVVVITIFAVTIASKIQSNKKMRSDLVSDFGKPPNKRNTEFESISKYYNHTKQDSTHIDKITWNDLDMDSVFERVNTCKSSVGEEYLYSILHQPENKLNKLEDRERLIKLFADDSNARLEAQYAMAKLGKLNYNGIAYLIFSSDTKILRWSGLYSFLAVCPILSIIAMFINLNIGIAGIILSFLVNLFVHYHTVKSVNSDLPTVGYFSSMMRCIKRLLRIKELSSRPIGETLTRLYGVFKTVASNAPSATSGMGGDAVDMFWTYFTILFLYDVRHYNKLMQKISKNSETFHEVFKILGEIEVALAVLSFRKSLPTFTQPTFHDENKLCFTDIYHPLIENPVTNTYEVKRNILLTGSNASGKSTFIKTLAINGILAQTIYTCTATQFSARFSHVVTAMAVQDNLQEGDSYFVVELKSLKRIIDLAKERFCICYVDEILRGTNTVERIAAATAVLEYLHKQNCICIAASHDIELTKLLAENYENLNFSEYVTEEGIKFDYKLKQGASATRNAIKLLKVIGFADDITERAEQMARE